MTTTTPTQQHNNNHHSQNTKEEEEEEGKGQGRGRRLAKSADCVQLDEVAVEAGRGGQHVQLLDRYVEVHLRLQEPFTCTGQGVSEHQGPRAWAKQRLGGGRREVVLVGLACVLDSQLLISGVALLQVQHQAAQALCRQGLDLFR